MVSGKRFSMDGTEKKSKLTGSMSMDTQKLTAGRSFSSTMVVLTTTVNDVKRLEFTKRTNFPDFNFSKIFQTRK